MQFARDTMSTSGEKSAIIQKLIPTVFDIAATAPTWQDAHEATQRALDGATSELERSALEQATSKMMLNLFLTRAPDDPEAARVALEYAERLVERKSPEAEVMLSAVETFGDAWPEARTRAVAIGAAEAAETYIAEGGSCADCERSPAAERSLRETGQDAATYEARQMRAAERLREAVQ